MACFGLVAVLGLTGCSAPSTRQHQGSPGGVAIIGVTSGPKLGVGVNGTTLAYDLAGFLMERDGLSILPLPQVQRVVGRDNLDELLQRFGAHGNLDGRDRQRLMAAGLPAARAIIVSVDSDEVRSRETVAEPIPASGGGYLQDRENIVQAVERETRLSAALLDLGSGTTIWQKSYSVMPVSRSSHVSYNGSSFSASLAATLANTMVNGWSIPAAPMAPSLRLNLRTLLREVALTLPQG